MKATKGLWEKRNNWMEEWSVLYCWNLWRTKWKNIGKKRVRKQLRQTVQLKRFWLNQLCNYQRSTLHSQEWQKLHLKKQNNKNWKIQSPCWQNTTKKGCDGGHLCHHSSHKEWWQWEKEQGWWKKEKTWKWNGKEKKDLWKSYGNYKW